MRRLEITIDHLPDKRLSPNSRVHWAVRYRATKEAKEEIGWLAKVGWGDSEPMMKARISYMFHAKVHRKRDLDNLLASCKAYQDGLIEVGVIFYDDADHLEIGSIELTQGQENKTVILVEEV
ncbi:hypothetical protein LCGC14_2366730 [marine sediment metagenome]|uniref:Uncharacterized protein n=1 Tax=marine sediment metagenome TaxID=412755 RepID=A0A0F9C4Y4_9ZZZZ